MPRRMHETPEEHLYGAQEAADLLGIHRSTLHLAVKRTLLSPDSFTPGGHMRFKRETLEAYATHLARQPATSSAHILADLARTLVLPDAAQAICRLAFSSIHQAVPALTMFGVAMHIPTAADPHALAHLASEGFEPRLPEIYAQLRPNLEFGVTTVLRTGEPEICDDTSHTEAMSLGTERLVRREGLGAYAILPLKHGDEVVGVLVAGSRRRHHVPAGEVSFLQSVANDLAVALICHNLFEHRERDLLSAADLTRRALELRAALPAAGKPDRSVALAELLTLFVERSGATLAGVAGTSAREAVVVGPGREHPLQVKRLRTLLGQARTAIPANPPAATTPSAARRERWSDEAGLQSGLAVSVPLARGVTLAVGASWPGERAAGASAAADEALLAALGAGCALLLLRDA